MDLPSVSPSPQMVGAASAASGVNVRLIDLTTGADLLAFPRREGRGPCKALVFSKDGGLAIDRGR